MVGQLTPDPTGSSPNPSNPTSPSEHACNPSPPDGLIATPSGSVTVVSRTSEPSSPPPFRAPCCETCTSTVSPEALLPAVVSGATDTDGANVSRLQPSRPTGSPLVFSSNASPDRHTPGSDQESAFTAVRMTSGPPQPVGSVKNGVKFSVCGISHGNMFLPAVCVAAVMLSKMQFQ